MPSVFLLIVLLCSPWFFFLVKINPLIVFLLIIFNFLLVHITFNRSGKIIKILTSVLFLIIVLFNLLNGFDKNIWVQTPREILQQERRHNFYAIGLGRIYTNKISLYYYTKISEPLKKIQENFFSNLDLNLFFFASHPRERPDVDEFEKYSFLALPFFLLGIFVAVKNRFLTLGLFFLAALLVSSFIARSYYLGPILFFPLINTVITLGLFSVIKKRVFK